MECMVRYDTLPQPQDSNAGIIWPSRILSEVEPKWQLEPRLRTNSEMSTESDLAEIKMATHRHNHRRCPSKRCAG